jgi:hypothetical protein
MFLSPGKCCDESTRLFAGQDVIQVRIYFCTNVHLQFLHANFVLLRTDSIVFDCNRYIAVDVVCQAVSGRQASSSSTQNLSAVEEERRRRAK